jgi:cytochrome P450
MIRKTPNHSLSTMACPHNLDDVDLFGDGAQEHWYESYEILHREAPVFRLPGEGLDAKQDGFVLSKYEDIERVVKDPARFPPTLSLMLNQLLSQDLEPEKIPGLNTMMASMMTLRPTFELWRSHRQELTDPWVGPGASRHEAMINQHVDDLLAAWPPSSGATANSVEFISKFARPLPQRVMASVLGFPAEDIERLALWGEAQVMPFVYGRGHKNQLNREQVAKQLELLQGFKEYVQHQLDMKRREPINDMISFVSQVEYQALGRKLTDIEINGIVYAMVIGGLETTQYAIAEQAQLLCDRPGLFSELKQDRHKLRHFVEESMRLRAPTQGLSTRITRQDEVFQGVPIPAGSLLHLRWAAGNIDSEAFENPHELQLERKAVSRHLSFSAGPRVCPGAGISRLEQMIAWDHILDQFNDISFSENNTFLHQPGIMLGTLNLNLRFH